MNSRRVRILIIACGALAALWPASADAQTPSPTTRCQALLTRQEVVAAVGTGFQGPALREPRPGFTSCDWQGADANFGFTFVSLSALKVDQQTAEQAFESDVSAVENDKHKRTALPNIGLKAAQVPVGDDAFLVEVLRADGAARMIFYKIPKAKIVALARAVGTPLTAARPAK